MKLEQVVTRDPSTPREGEGCLMKRGVAGISLVSVG